MLEPGGEADLPQEPLRSEGRRQLLAEHLERHRLAVLEVAGEVDHSHAAAAELALDMILLCQGFPQCTGRWGQQAPLGWDSSNVRGYPTERQRPRARAGQPLI